jgi:4-amino-4-deoxy-L-arabinose transferase-like glycosyltransferase
MLVVILVATFLRFYRLWDLPRALWIDEAFYGLDALRVLQDGHFSIFFPQNGGREPLFIYLQAGAIALLGNAPWALRVVPAFTAILTLPIVYCLGRELFSDDKYGRYIGLATAATLAVSYWHVNFSHLGFRVILLLPTSALALLFFWRGWRRARQRDFVWSGLALGLAMYTYLSARVLPFILLAFGLTLVVLGKFDRRCAKSFAARQILIGLGIVIGIAALISTPLFIYFYWCPEDLINRTASVILTAEDPAASPVRLVTENTVKIVRMFIDRGDLNPRHNLPGRPALDLLSMIGFWVAVFVGVILSRSKPVYILLFVWVFGMLAPSALSTDAPHFLRTLGALVPVMILAGDGLTRIWQRLLPVARMSLLVPSILLFGGIVTFNDYFQVWGQNADDYPDAFDTRFNLLDQRIRGLIETSDILLPLRLYGRPTLQFALGTDFRERKALPLDLQLSRSLAVVTAQGSADKQWVLLHKEANGKGIVYFPHTMTDVANLREGLPQPITDLRGRQVGTVIPLSEKAKMLIQPPLPSQRLDANFADKIRLVGYDVDTQRAKPGQRLELALYWEPIIDLDRDYRIFVHLIDDASLVHAQWDSEPVFGFYTSGLWRRGMVVTDLYPIHIPAGISPGQFRFEVGWISATEDRLPLLDSAGQIVDDRFIFGQITITVQTSQGAGQEIARKGVR